MAIEKQKVLITIELLLIVLLSISAGSYFFTSLNSAASSIASIEPEAPEPNYLYDVLIDTLHVEENTIQKNQFLADILLPYNITYQTIDQLVKKAENVFDVRKLRTDRKYSVLCSTDSLKTAQYFIYDPSPYFYVVYDLRDSLDVYKVERQVDIRTKTVSGVVYTSLWNAIADNNMPWELAVELENIYGWSVDFHHLQEGDRFKLIYEEESIEGETVGIGIIRSALFEHRDSDVYGFYYGKDGTGFGDHYYDENARPLRKAFLKSPVKYTRISSPFNLRRFHPVLKRVRPHLGTDYAAPHGTPIYAVADGNVLKASYSRGNGRYVKIKHDKVYTTQYLHMSKFAKGITGGVHVKQGQVIGYVGSTGLATGPHVCFRFWKNGKQVDHRREKLPPPEPMPNEYVAEFNILKDSLKQVLDQIPYLSEEALAQKRELLQDSTYVVEDFLP